MPDTYKQTFSIPATGLTASVSAFLAPTTNTTVQVFPSIGTDFSFTAIAGTIYPIKAKRIKPTTTAMIGFN